MLSGTFLSYSKKKGKLFETLAPCHSLLPLVPLVVIRCYSLSFVFTRYTTRFHSSLVAMQFITRLFFINDPKISEIISSFIRKENKVFEILIKWSYWQGVNIRPKMKFRSSMKKILFASGVVGVKRTINNVSRPDQDIYDDNHVGGNNAGIYRRSFTLNQHSNWWKAQFFKHSTMTCIDWNGFGY